MSYLIDSDWVAEYLKGRERARRVLTSIARDGLTISIITYGEILEGVIFGRDAKAQMIGFTQFLRFVRVHTLTRRTMHHFARIRGDLRHSGLSIGDADVLIAATAIERNLTLLTLNHRHFERIPTLRLFPPVS